MNPSKFSLRYPAVALILAAMAVAVGIYAFLYMPSTEDPTITIRTGLVIALYPGATSEQVEKQVTNQPKVVNELVSHLGREFLIAILSVVLVTIILLPGFSLRRVSTTTAASRLPKAKRVLLGLRHLRA